MLAVTASAGGLTLAGELDIYAVRDLHEALSARLEGAGPLVLNLSRVERVDGAGLQLLWWLHGALAARQRAIAFEAVSAPVEEALRFMRFPGGLT